MFGSGRCCAWPAVYRCIDILPEPWTLVRGPRPKHIGPWSTDLEPWILDSVWRRSERGSRLLDAEPGLLGLVAGYGSNWVEGVGRVLAGLAARTLGGDGLRDLATYKIVDAK